MKILHIIATLDPASGGPPEGIRQVSIAMMELGHSVEVVSLDSSTADYLKPFPIPAHALGPRIGNWAFTRKLYPWLLENGKRFDVFIAHASWLYTNLVTARAANRLNLPYFLFPHGGLDPWFNKNSAVKRLKKQIYWKLFEHKIMEGAADVLYTSEQERQGSATSFSPPCSKGSIVGYGTHGSSEDPSLLRKQFLKEFPELKSTRNITFLGRIHPKKGCDLLLQAFARIASRDASLRLVFVGPDTVQWAAHLRQMTKDLGIGDRVIWTGPLVGELKWGALYNSEVFILPSHQENFGISVVEALSCAVPVLISDQVNIASQVAADGAGFVEKDTFEGTTTLLHRWFSLSEKQKKELSVRAKSCFENRFRMDRVVESYLKILRAHSPAQTPQRQRQIS